MTSPDLGKEMEELRAAADSWRQDFADDHVSFAALHVRRAIDAVLAATPRVETAPSGDVALLTKERDEAIAKLAEEERAHDALTVEWLNDPSIRDVNAAEARARKAEVACSRLGAENGKLRQQIAALKELVREFAREGGDGK